MEVEFMAEYTEDTSRDRALQIIKRKRTKRQRQRPCSPFRVPKNSGNSSTNVHCSIDNSTHDQSLEISTQEDEDMANCLIMLAQSEAKTDQIHQKTEKLRANNDDNNSGYYVHECKTCNRSFPSFQALGGHKASHKKAKLNVCEKIPSYLNIQPLEEDITITSTSTNNRGKVHECSICGLEFSSGQALGGHMRKHRLNLPSVNRTVSVTEKSVGGSTSTLSLDLNFPPPEAINDVVETKFRFSVPALVDCYY
ncbi:zinc finger protein ZAT5-like [Bidens hawaiensis]|uniref:zinc finger protein ZAT5-like n=1 Tax=Bidens hawaiensis TaxID=980011 RepID=UPI00404AE100